MAIERVEPPGDADERGMVEGWLDFHRATLDLKCAGLTDEQLRRAAVKPSALTLLGLVRHMTEVERHWFARVFAGRSGDGPLYFSDEIPDGDFRVGPADTYQEAAEAWRAQIKESRIHTELSSLDELSAGADRSGERYTLRWICSHMVEEYARHNGHADLIREAIDGRTGE